MLFQGIGAAGSDLTHWLEKARSFRNDALRPSVMVAHTAVMPQAAASKACLWRCATGYAVKTEAARAGSARPARKT